MDNQIYNKESKRWIKTNTAYYKKLEREGWHVNPQGEFSPPKVVAKSPKKKEKKETKEKKENKEKKEVKQSPKKAPKSPKSKHIHDLLNTSLIRYLTPNDLLSLYLSNKENQLALNQRAVIDQLNRLYHTLVDSDKFTVWLKEYLSLKISKDLRYLYALEQDRYIDDQVIDAIVGNKAPISQTQILIVFDWISEVLKKFKVRANVREYVYSLFLVFVTNVKPMIAKESAQLYISVVAHLATLLFEEYPAEMSDYVYISDGAFSNQELQNAIQTVLTTLQGRLFYPTASMFVDRTNDDLFLLSLLASSDISLSVYKPSVIAETCTYMITGKMQMYSKQEVMPICAKILKHITLLSKSNLPFLEPRAALVLNAIKYSCDPSFTKLSITTPLKYNAPWHIGEVEKLGILGEGAFGQVRKVKRKQCGTEYAIKKTDADEEGNVNAAYQEIAILTLLNNQNYITSLCGFALTTDKIMMVLPLYSFSLLGAQTKLEKSKLGTYFKQIIEGVRNIHNFDIIHRDIKAENILYDSVSDKIYIIDFGISVPFQSIRKPNDCSLANTFWYRPPECLYKEISPYNTKIDIWAMGCVFYYLVAGKFFITPGSEVDGILDSYRLLGGTIDEQLYPKIEMYTKKKSISFPGQREELKVTLGSYNDLVLDCLTIDPNRRASAQELLDRYYS